MITPIPLSGGPGNDPLAPLDVPGRRVDGPVVPAGPGHNIDLSFARMAEAIRNGAAAAPDFGHALGVHRILDLLHKSSDERRAIGVAT